MDAQSDMRMHQILLVRDPPLPPRTVGPPWAPGWTDLLSAVAVYTRLSFVFIIERGGRGGTSTSPTPPLLLHQRFSAAASAVPPPG